MIAPMLGMIMFERNVPNFCTCTRVPPRGAEVVTDMLPPTRVRFAARHVTGATCISKSHNGHIANHPGTKQACFHVALCGDRRYGGVQRRPDRSDEEKTMKALRFYAPEDVRLEDVPEPDVRSRRGEAQGQELLDLRHRRQDLLQRAPEPHAPAHHRPRDRRRGRRGGRERHRRLAGRRPRPGDRGGALRRLLRVPEGLDGGLPEPDVGRLPVRRRLRGVHDRARARCSRSTASTRSPTTWGTTRPRPPSRSRARSTPRSCSASRRATPSSSSAPARSAACTSASRAACTRPDRSTWSTSTPTG